VDVAHMIAVVVLAAGRATRMGANGRSKVLLRVAGRTLLAHAVASARGSACEPVLVVAGADAEEVSREAASLGVRVVVNPRYAEGMATSLAAGIAALPPGAEAAVVLLGDQPRVGAAAIDRLIATFRATGSLMVLSRYGGVAGVPALISRDLFPEVTALTGDAGARAVASRHPGRVAEVPLAPEDACDIDTPEDFARLRQALEPYSPEDTP
jgi:molybdenum cofactor cytidylyltransferase